MTRTFKTLSDLRNHLAKSVVESIENEVTKVCMEVVQKSIQQRVYDAYTPQGEWAYDRTNELRDCVTIGNISVGTKYVRFEVFMDTEKIRAHITEGDKWNQHADVWSADVSEMIPYWIEHGTNGSLWDRPPADYMEQAHHTLDGGKLANALERGLRSRGWKVVAL